MNNKYDVAQLFLRYALGIGFLLPVMDRLGWLGAAGQNGNAWGNWTNFVAYTHSLMPYMNISLAGIMSVLATVAEVVFGIALILGYKTGIMAKGSCLLTLAFAVSMFFFADARAPFTYSVFAVSGASLLLSCIPHYKWSLDQLISRPQ